MASKQKNNKTVKDLKARISVLESYLIGWWCLLVLGISIGGIFGALNWSDKLIAEDGQSEQVSCWDKEGNLINGVTCTDTTDNTVFIEFSKILIAIFGVIAFFATLGMISGFAGEFK